MNFIASSIACTHKRKKKLFSSPKHPSLLFASILKRKIMISLQSNCDKRKNILSFLRKEELKKLNNFRKWIRALKKNVKTETIGNIILRSIRHAFFCSKCFSYQLHNNDFSVLLILTRTNQIKRCFCIKPINFKSLNAESKIFFFALRNVLGVDRLDVWGESPWIRWHFGTENRSSILIFTSRVKVSI